MDTVVYVCVPRTAKVPGPVRLAVPASGSEPSPQLIVALKSPAIALLLASVNVATTPLKAFPTVDATGEPEAAIAALSTDASTLTSVRVGCPLVAPVMC